MVLFTPNHPDACTDLDVDEADAHAVFEELLASYPPEDETRLRELMAEGRS